LVLLYKSTGIFNFAVGQMMMLGAFVCWTLHVQMTLPLWLSIILTLIFCGLLGLVIERLIMRPLIGQPLLTAILVTLSLSYLLTGIATGIWGGYIQAMPEILPTSPVSLGGIIFPNDLLLSFFLAMAFFALLFFCYQRTRVGLAMRATAVSHQIAQARGINVRMVFSLSWILCAVILAICGVIASFRLGISQYLAQAGLRVFPAILFGGLGSVGGALIGGLTVGMLESLAGGLIAPWMMEVTPYIILLLVLISRPGGLFGQKGIERI